MNKKYIFNPPGCPKAGFYADLGHKCLTPFIEFLENYFKQHNCLPDVSISGINLWKNYQSKEKIDYYPILFKEDISVNLNLPITHHRCDTWTIIPYTNFTDYNLLLKRFFSMSLTQQKKYEERIQKYNLNLNETIGVVYRGTDKYKETTLVDPQYYIETVDSILQKHPTFKIIIQTDQQQVRDMFIKKYNKQCVFFNEMPVTMGSEVIHNIIPKDRCCNFLRELEISIRILSNCNVIVTGVSNLTTIMGAYRNNPTNVYQYDLNCVLQSI